MAVKDGLVVIVGCGPGSVDYITAAGLQAIGQAEVVMGAKRLLDVFSAAGQRQIPVGVDVNVALDELEAAMGTGKVAVLVSGDPGLKSFAANVIGRIGRERCRIIPGISSVQTAFARLGIDWDDARIISAHERVPSAPPASLTGASKIAVLAGGGQSAAWIREAARELDGDYRIYLCRDLTLDDESVEQVGSDDLTEEAIPARSVVLFIKEDCFR